MGLYGNGFVDFMNGNNTSFESVFEYADNFMASLDPIFETYEIENIYAEAGVTLALTGPTKNENIITKITETAKTIFKKFVDAVKTFFSKTLPEMITKLYQSANVKDKLFTLLGRGVVTWKNIEKAKEEGWPGLSHDPKKRQFMIFQMPDIAITNLYEDILDYTERHEKILHKGEFGDWEDKESSLTKLINMADEIGKANKERNEDKALSQAQSKYEEFKDKLKEFNPRFTNDDISSTINKGRFDFLNSSKGEKFRNIIGIPEDRNGAEEGYYYPKETPFAITVKVVEEGQSISKKYKNVSTKSLSEIKEWKDFYKTKYKENKKESGVISRIMAMDAKAHLELYTAYLRRSMRTIHTIGQVFLMFQQFGFKTYFAMANAVKKYVNKEDVEKKEKETEEQ